MSDVRGRLRLLRKRYPAPDRAIMRALAVCEAAGAQSVDDVLDLYSRGELWPDPRPLTPDERAELLAWDPREHRGDQPARGGKLRLLGKE